MAFALFSAPINQATTVTYWLQGHQVGPTQVQLGGVYNLQKSAHTVFDTVQFSWSTPTDFRFSQGTFDAVPEPSTLLLLGSGLVGMLGVVRRKLF
jgi:PEP-CTERM motif